MAVLLGRRALNRALLRRQHLLARTRMPALDMIEHLVGMQAQAPYPPYVGLWTRLRGFRHAELAGLLTSAAVARLTMMRGTVHLVSARDCIGLRPLLRPVLTRMLVGTGGVRLSDTDLAGIVARCRALVDEAPRTPAELADSLREHWPEHTALTMLNAARALVPLVQLPPRAVWGTGGQARYVTAEKWLGGPLSAVPVERMIERYLAAFGPATVGDIQAWCGLTRLREITDRMSGSLRVFRADSGAELLDLPDAPRPDPDTPAPPRFVPEFDNLVLSHADRTRIVADDHRRALLTRNGIVPGTVLVDGFVCGVWRITTERKHATLTVQPFARLSKKNTVALESAGTRLLRFYADTADTHSFRVE
jgi:hypothetical protein